MSRTVDGLLKSPSQRVRWQEARLRRRHDHGLSPGARKAHESDALSRAQRSSQRSFAARDNEQQLREMWPTDMTVRDIARKIGTTVDNVKKMRQRLGLPPRPRGRGRRTSRE